MNHPASSANAPARPHLAVLGDVFFEVVFGEIARLPRPGEEIFPPQFGMSCGGVITVAAAAAEAGARAELVSSLGTDLGSRLAIDFCAARGIGLEHARRMEVPAAGMTVVLNFDGDRSFISHLPLGAFGSERHASWWLDALEAARPEWIYLHAQTGVVDVIRAAKELGCRIALDVDEGEIDRDRDAVLACVALADLFLPNENELLHLAGTTSLEAAILEYGALPGALVLKQGAQGALVVSGGRRTQVIDGVLDVDVLDRTGAGDAFAGAVIARLALGAELIDAVVAGNGAGSRAVSRLGAVGALEVA